MPTSGSTVKSRSAAMERRRKRNLKSNKVLECNGNSIKGIGLLYGVRLNGTSNVTIKNCVIDRFGDGMLLLNSSTNNTLDNNTVINNTVFGIRLTDDSDYNNITGNTVTNNSHIKSKSGTMLARILHLCL